MLELNKNIEVYVEVYRIVSCDKGFLINMHVYNELQRVRG